MLTRRLLRPSPLSLTHGSLSSTKQQQRYPRRMQVRPAQHYSEYSAPPPQSAKQPDGKLKKFMKSYGYVGVGVYLGLSVVDLGLTMALIHVKGADKVEQLERWIVTKVKTTLGMPVPSPESTQQQQQQQQYQRQPSWTSIFVLAYGIHKTVLLPVRLSLTAAATPMVAKKLASWGWIKRQSLPKVK